MASLVRRAPQYTCQCQRAFSTSVPRSVGLQWDKNNSEALSESLPQYPYGPARWFKQAGLGLYGGQRVQTGNNVGPKFKTKTRRTWYPNILTRKLFSKALNRSVQVRVSARVLKTIDKLGGLDEYLLGEKETRIKELGESGWWLRWTIMQTEAVKQRFVQQRQALGLPDEVIETAAPTEIVDTEAATALKGEEELDTEEVVSDEELEPVLMDDAFTIESAPDLPPLKFRVGPGKHVVLTADGWRRTRPDSSRRVKIEKDNIAQKYFPNYVAIRTAEFNRRTAEQGLSEHDRKLLKKVTQGEFEAELDAKVDKIYQANVWSKKSRAAEREQIRKQKRSESRAQESRGEIILDV